MHADLLVLDVDGVLTDGSITIDSRGEETKTFHVRDGFAIRLWLDLGLRVAIVTGRTSAPVEHRARELGIAHVLQGVRDKARAVESLCASIGVPLERTAAIADDWPEIGMLRRIGHPIAVADAAPEVKAIAAYVTRAPGGRGAVREAIEHLLGVNGLLDRARSLYDPGANP